MKTSKQKQAQLQVPLDSLPPLRFHFEIKERREGMFDSVRAKFRVMDGKIILSARGKEAETEHSLRLCADLESADVRAYHETPSRRNRGVPAHGLEGIRI